MAEHGGTPLHGIFFFEKNDVFLFFFLQTRVAPTALSSKFSDFFLFLFFPPDSWLSCSYTCSGILFFVFSLLTCVAASYGSFPEIVALLLSRGADINLKNKIGLTARQDVSAREGGLEKETEKV